MFKENQPRFETQEKDTYKTMFLAQFKQLARDVTIAGLIAIGGISAYENYFSQVSKSKASSELSAADLIELKQNVEYILDEHPKEVISLFELREDIIEERNSEPPAFKGFEDSEIGKDLPQELWNEVNYPKNSIDRTTDEVEFVTTGLKADESYNLQNDEASGMTFYEKSKIILAKSSSTEGLSDFKEIADTYDATFAHEWGHKNDWFGQENLSTVERLEFFAEVSRAFDREGAVLKNGYVNRINNPDKKLEKFYKVVEWWAELTQAYMMFPENFEKGCPEEFQLVDKWVKKLDPNFDPVESVAKRAAIKAKYAK